MSTTIGPAGGLRGLGARTFSSLGKYPDFRVLWAGNVGTMLGQWVQFAVQAAAYALSVLATMRIRTRGEPTAATTTSVLRSMADGIAYARNNRDVWLLVVMAGLPSLLVYPYVQYIPVFADKVLHTGPGGFGLLASAVGYGSIVGAILAANLTNLKRRGPILVWTTFAYMSLVTAFALSNIYALSFALLVVAGVANSTYLMLNQVMIQLVVDDEYRGRVLSLYVMVSGLTPFSALLMGALIDAFGAQVTVACFTGLAAAIVLAIGVTSRRLREI